MAKRDICALVRDSRKEIIPGRVYHVDASVPGIAQGELDVRLDNTAGLPNTCCQKIVFLGACAVVLRCPSTCPSNK